MHLIVFVLALGLAIQNAAAQFPVGCGKQAPQLQPELFKFLRIINGMEAKPHSWPWLATLVIDFGNTVSMCGSNLIRVSNKAEESDILVTAAHCVTWPETMGTRPQGLPPGKFLVIAGNHRHDNVELGEQRRVVSQVRFHPGFRFAPESGANNDIALIKLSQPLKFTTTIRPICLPAPGEEIPVSKTCVIAGWGRNNSARPDITPMALQQMVVPVHPPKTCTGSSGWFGFGGSEGWGDSYKEDQMICAGPLQPTGGACQGDSGGMLACQNAAGEPWVLYGTTSFGVGGTCLENGKPGIFARVSSYMDWIAKNALEMTSVA